LFTGHVALMALLQLPIARLLKRMAQPRALMVSACLWGLAFTLVWAVGVDVFERSSMGAGLALGTMAIAITAYNPVAASFVVMLAPDALRGVYLSVNSMCWAVGYFIGPPIGGWALDQSPQIANTFWLVAALSVVPILMVLSYLDRQLANQHKRSV